MRWLFIGIMWDLCCCSICPFILFSILLWWWLYISSIRLLLFHWAGVAFCYLRHLWFTENEDCILKLFILTLSVIWNHCPLLFSHWMHMTRNLVEISVGVWSGHLLQNGICLQSSLCSVDMDGFLSNVSHWIGDFFWTNQTAVLFIGLSMFVCRGHYVER